MYMYKQKYKLTMIGKNHISQLKYMWPSKYCNFIFKCYRCINDESSSSLYCLLHFASTGKMMLNSQSLVQISPIKTTPRMAKSI